MNFKHTAILTTMAILCAAPAHANLLFDVYAGATGGIGGATMFTDNHAHSDSAYSFGGVIGIDIPFVRIEGEYNHILPQDTKLNTAMLNAYLKMPTTLVQPYIGAGIGIIFDGDVDNTDIKIKDKTAYQGMLGLTFDIPVLPFKIDAEGRVLYSHDIYTVADIKPDILHYDARLKVRYIF